MNSKKLESNRLSKLRSKQSQPKEKMGAFDLQVFVVFLAKLVPIVTLIAVIASSVKLAIFYDVFGIKIVDYIGVTEYLPLFIDELHGLLRLAAVVLATVILIKIFRIKPHPKEVYEARLENKPFRITWIVLTIIYIVGIAIVLYVNFDTVSERIERLGMAYILLLMFLFMIRTSYEIGKGSATVFFSVILSIPIVPLLLSGYTEAYVILENRNENEYELIFEDEVIKSDSEIHFLGKSKDYIFLFNSTEKKAIIKTGEKLKEMRIIAKSK